MSAEVEPVESAEPAQPVAPEEAATAPGLLADAPAELAALAPHRNLVLGRFAALVAEGEG